MTDFFNDGLILKIRIIFYTILMALSFFIFVGVSVMKDKAKDHCPLYLEKRRLFYIYNGAESNCDYTIAVAVIFQLVYLAFRTLSLVMMLVGKISKDHFLFSSTFFQFFYVAVDLIAAFLTLVSAFILTVGSKWEAAEYNFEWRLASEVAQGGAWISFILWTKLGVGGLLILWKSGQLPCLPGNRQASSPTNGSTQREMVDPASEKFGVC